MPPPSLRSMNKPSKQPPLLATFFVLVSSLGLFFDSEDEGDMFLRKLVDFKLTIRHYILEDRTLHNHRCEDLKSYISFLFCLLTTLSISIPILSIIYSSMALQSFVGPWPFFFSFLILYTVGRTPWTWDQPVARLLPIHRTNTE
jgi:hypothetical protein